MDGAWALYEAWVKIQTGEVDIALVYGYGKSSPGRRRATCSPSSSTRTTSPRCGPTRSRSPRCRRGRGSTPGKATDEQTGRGRRPQPRNAMANQYAQLAVRLDPARLAGRAVPADPLRKHDCPPITDGARGRVLAADDVARELCDRPAWIRGIDHRIESHVARPRDLTTSPSTALGRRRRPASADGPVDVAELHAPFTHQELILARRSVSATTSTSTRGAARWRPTR